MQAAPIASEWKPQRPFQDRAFLVVFIPFAAAVLIFIVFFLSVEHIPGGSTEARGQFGDAFGVLNSLYSGLGFSGVVATLYFQQVQIKKQGEETKRQFLDAAERSYEDNLYRTLGVYRATLESVTRMNGDVKTRSLDALAASTNHMLKAIKLDGCNALGTDLKKRIRRNQATTADQELIEYIYWRNFWHITRTLSRQSRLIETFKVLLRQLEDRAPAHLDTTPYRNVISAQLTHIEMTYFFFIALGFSAESELRELLRRSGVLKLMGAAKKSEIHTEMFNRYWGFDLRDSGVKREFPIPGHRIRQLTKHEKAIRARLPVPPRAKALPAVPLTGKAPVSRGDAIIDQHLAADESLDEEGLEGSEMQAGAEAAASSSLGGPRGPGLGTHGDSDQGWCARQPDEMGAAWGRRFQRPALGRGLQSERRCLHAASRRAASDKRLLVAISPSVKRLLVDQLTATSDLQLKTAETETSDKRLLAPVGSRPSCYRR